MSIKLNGVRYLLLLVCLVVWSTPSIACTKLSYNGGEEWFPFFYRKGGIALGIVNDVLKNATDQSGFNLSLATPKPWKRLLLELKSGSLELLAGVTHDPAWGPDFLYSVPVAHIDISIFNLHQSDFTFKELTDLNGKFGVKTLGMNLSPTVEDYAFENLVIEETVSAKSLFKMIEVGRVDYGIMYKYAGEQFLRENKLDKLIKAQPVSLAVENVYIAATQKSPCTNNIKQILAAIESMKEAGKVKAIYEHYQPGSVHSHRSEEEI